jgi:hypothetical protein
LKVSKQRLQPNAFSKKKIQQSNQLNIMGDEELFKLIRNTDLEHELKDA